MNKVGFLIKVINGGDNTPCVYNDGEWSQKICDPRHYLRVFNELNGTDEILSAISFSESGCYIMLLHGIKGRAGDCLSTWIFIPSYLDIDGRQVMDIYDYAKTIISSPNIADINEDIKSFFNKDYHTKDRIRYTPSAGERLAYRYFNGSVELEELLGNKRYQEYYSKYETVFLLDRNSKISLNNSYDCHVENLTDKTLSEYCIVFPPSQQELASMGKGTLLVFEDNRSITGSFLKKKGDTIEYMFRREGFECLKRKETIIKDTHIEIPQDYKWQKKIDRSLFDVRNEDEETVEVHKIIVDGHDISGKPLLLGERDCENVKFSVVASKAYEKYDGAVNLLTQKGKIKVVLKRAERIENYKIELANGKEAEITLKSKNLVHNGKSPLAGYALDTDRSLKKLHVSLMYKLKYFSYGIAASVALLLLIVGYQSFDNYDFRLGWPPFVEINSEENLADTTEVSDSTAIKAALGYLDGNEKWSKAAMDTLTAFNLGDVYNSLKAYRFEELLNASITGCKRYEEIKDVARKALKKGVVMSSDYPDDPDSTITVSGWKKKVEEQIKRAEKDTQEEPEVSIETESQTENSESDKVRKDIKKNKEQKQAKNPKESKKRDSGQNNSSTQKKVKSTELEGKNRGKNGGLY